MSAISSECPVTERYPLPHNLAQRHQGWLNRTRMRPPLSKRLRSSRLSVINRFHRQSASLSTKFEDWNLRPSHLRKLRLRALQGLRVYRDVFARVERTLDTPTRLR